MQSTPFLFNFLWISYYLLVGLFWDCYIYLYGLKDKNIQSKPQYAVKLSSLCVNIVVGLQIQNVFFVIGLL